MQANEIVMTGLGGPEVLESRLRDLPAPGRGEVLVEVEAAGVAFAEVQMLRGRYPMQPKFPFVPGYDLVGTVRETGPGVSLREGQRVVSLTRTGAWTDRLVLKESQVVPAPADLDATDMVALIVNGVTAWQMLHRVARVQSGQTVLVHGAAGGVGTILSQLARLAGARVIGTASAGKHDALRAMGVEPIDYRAGNVPDEVRGLAPDGVDAVFDHLGGRSFVDSYDLLAPGGTVIWYGSASTLKDGGHWVTPIVKVLARLGFWQVRRVLGLARGRRGRMYYIKADDRFRTDVAHVVSLAVNGQIDAKVAGRYPLSQAATALRELVDGKVTGKLVLVP
jgi:NADPH:quinone reductase-like Zn-dependent oxidoreductase